MSLFVNPIDYTPTIGKVRENGRQEISFVDTNQTKRTIDSTKERIDEYIKVRNDNGKKLSIAGVIGGLVSGFGAIGAMLALGGKKNPAKKFGVFGVFAVACYSIFGVGVAQLLALPSLKKRLDVTIKNLEVPENKNEKTVAEEIETPKAEVKKEKETAAADIKEVNEIKKELEEVKEAVKQESKIDAASEQAEEVKPEIEEKDPEGK